MRETRELCKSIYDFIGRNSVSTDHDIKIPVATLLWSCEHLADVDSAWVYIRFRCVQKSQFSNEGDRDWRFLRETVEIWDKKFECELNTVCSQNCFQS
jgi:hypothetical protein